MYNLKNSKNSLKIQNQTKKKNFSQPRSIFSSNMKIQKYLIDTPLMKKNITPNLIIFVIGIQPTELFLSSLLFFNKVLFFFSNLEIKM
jgi:hypothetical protein